VFERRSVSPPATARLAAWLFACLWLPLAAVAAAADGAVSDPTEPPSVGKDRAAAPAAPARLQSILVGAERRLAVIDGDLLAEGEGAAGFKLEAVLADEVRVRLADGSLRTLALETHTTRKEER